MANSVSLNVGGTIYTTTIATLTRFPNSALGQLIKDNLAAKCEESTALLFIDRDGPLFRYILGYLRSNRLLLPDDFGEIDALMVEAEYYNIPDLIDDIREWVRNVKDKKTLRVEERTFAQSSRMHQGTFVDWTVTAGDSAPILWLTQIGVFANDTEVSVTEDGKTLHRSWYNDIRAGQTQDGYAYAFGNPQTHIDKVAVFDEIKSLGYRLISMSPISAPFDINPILRPFVVLQSAKVYEFFAE